MLTGWDGTSFTTMEAERVLTRVGFLRRRAGLDDEGRRGWIADQSTDGDAQSTVAPRGAVRCQAGASGSGVGRGAGGDRFASQPRQET